MAGQLIDSYSRKIDYLRLSITDRCNLRCIYCMPERGIKLLDKKELLTYEEILKTVRILSELGIRKVRLTGGEPLLRENILELIEGIKDIEGVEDISITTNGILLSGFLKKLFKQGIRRINISLDSLDREKYRNITRGGDPEKILAAIDSAINMGFESVKINVVLTSLFDEKDCWHFIKMSMEKPVSIRFIEMMPVIELDPLECSGNVLNGNNKKIDTTGIFKSMSKFGEYNKIEEPVGFGPAVYYKIEKSRGNIGFIQNKKDSCFYCNRIRLTSRGTIKLCLFADSELDIKRELRNNISSKQIKERILDFIKVKPGNRNLNINCNKENDIKISNYMNRIGG